MEPITIFEFQAYLDIKLNPKKRSWSIKFKAPNLFIFETPKAISKEEAFMELKKHYRFVKRCMTKVENIYSNSIHLYGKEYELKIEPSALNQLLILDEQAILYTNSDNKEVHQRIIGAFYKEELSRFIERSIGEAKKRMKIDFPIEIEYKKVKTYYGECFTKRKKIIFSEALVKYEEILILSVLYHELAHFYYPNHQAGFYQLLEQVFPNYRQYQLKLRKTKYNDYY